MKPAGTCCLYDGSHIIWLLQSWNAEFHSKLTIFVLYNLETWWMTLTNNRAPPLHHFKLCASFNSRQWIQTRVTVRKRPNWGKICFMCYMAPNTCSKYTGGECPHPPTNGSKCPITRCWWLPLHQEQCYTQKHPKLPRSVYVQRVETVKQ